MVKTLDNSSISNQRASNSRPLYRFVAFVLSLVILSINVAASGTSPNSTDIPARASAVSSDFADSLVICTATGMVMVDKTGGPTPSQSKDGHRILCAYCLPLLHGAVDFPIQSFEIAPPEQVALTVYAGTTTIPDALSRRRGTASPRAPPLA
jgi:hypothetical protein